MNCFLTCPKNLLNNEKDDNKELKFLEIFDDSKNDIGNKRNIKKHLFHYLIMPFLDFHYQIIFHKIVSPYKNNNFGLSKDLVKSKFGEEEEENEDLKIFGITYKKLQQEIKQKNIKNIKKNNKKKKKKK